MVDLPTALALFAAAVTGLTAVLAATMTARHERLVMWSSRLASPTRHREPVSSWLAIGAAGHGNRSFRTTHVDHSLGRRNRKAA